MLQWLGRFRESMTTAQKLLALDGLNVGYLGVLASAQMALRDYGAAEQTVNRMAEIDPRSDLTASSLSGLSLLQGRYAESLAECPKISDERTRLSCVAHAQHSLGHRAEAGQALSDLLAECLHAGETLEVDIRGQQAGGRRGRDGGLLH